MDKKGIVIQVIVDGRTLGWEEIRSSPPVMRFLAYQFYDSYIRVAPNKSTAVIWVADDLQCAESTVWKYLRIRSEVLQPA